VIVETDGRRTHGTRQAFEKDRRTDLRLTAARWRPVRVTGRRLDHEPGLVVDAVLGLLEG
jgi:very-short-patch-repair endonuclease